ncbi:MULTISPECIES: plantaricin C family lantibiotic [Bacillus]|uniref:Plantaricin C family lantibiotic n=1 Tax=Bacillus velezensis TaxID=492670 RepID=A0A6A8LAY7_BACVE|nr:MULTISPECIES: plantaricin C family lantibiotic [Bacillus]AUJ60257.1 hypothetical protein B6257_06445 [Bacillus velezensis]AWM84449.1 plantaricin C family lantibiotic [Bacillus velezensis]AYV17075.1 plantaricin C family lantibiotic [Bacillus velezensis]ERH50303.1 hypothetical protein O205_15175 [Bacillus amyloliquefaciens EGD-AQ14]KAF6535880.1 plantaricin C family lantibiotic [Bacillus sp. EKM208B]
MKKTKILKTPELKVTKDLNLIDPCGDVLEEIKEHEVSGAFNTWNTTTTSLGGILVSEVLGNKGKVCTGTKECQGTC